MVLLRYDRGTILVQGNIRVPNSSWDSRVGAFRTLALYYPEVQRFLNSSNMTFEDEVLDPPPCPSLRSKTKLRAYQEEALKAWLRAGKRGVVVLPTGAGKTILALAAIAHVNAPAIIVVPTIDLLDQWRENLAREFGIEIFSKRDIEIFRPPS